jgi:hypothetical protein
VTNKQFEAGLAKMGAADHLSADYIMGFRRGLQRGLYGDRVVAPAEHGAWLALAQTHPEWVERVRGYRDGIVTGEELADQEPAG